MTADDGVAEVVVCTTCRFDKMNQTDADGRRGGEHLLAALQAARDEDPRFSQVGIVEQACLWACSDHCTVYLRAAGKPAYLAGRFEPTAEAAQDIMTFAAAYADSPEGAVAYRDWPEGMKGHFIARLPTASD